MSTPERSEGALSPWTPPPASIQAARPSWGDTPADDAAPPKAISARVVLRALRRHWWQVLALWFAGSSALVYLAYTRIKPTYDAVAWLDVEPPTRSLLADGSSTAENLLAYMDTQVLLVTSPDVLSDAIRDPKIAALPKIRGSVDPDVELRKEIGVAIPKNGAHVIMVKMTGEDPGEVAAIVNAVTKSYLSKSRIWVNEESRDQIGTLRAMEKASNAEVVQQRAKVRDMAKKGNVNPAGEAAAANGEKEAADLGKQRLTVDQYRTLRAEFGRVRVRRGEAEIAVTYYENALRDRVGRAPAPTAAATAEQVDAQVKEEFYNLPQAIELKREIAAAEDKVEQAKKKIRLGHDPTVKRVKDQLDDLNARWQELWSDTYPALKGRAMRRAEGPPDSEDVRTTALEDQVRNAKLQLQQFRLQEKDAEEQCKNAEIEFLNANHEALDVKFEQDDLARLDANLTKIRNQLSQLDYEGQRNGERIKLRAEARPLRSPSGNNRIKAMAAAPVLMLLISCGLFVLLEARSGRVADPDELSQRVRVGVIGVVPPLPSLNAPGQKSLSARGQRDERRRVEEFIQSLDQLRVTLCVDRPGMARQRCILITSATGGEGKTTLAAQLAGRCANAGLMTLLIDADLRRPSLGDLLEVPEGPGLVDVLSGDASAEAAMVVIGNAGGFHLLPAGTMGQDPSRLLHGDRLGQLIHQFRETFDMVIIDAPPVLAVPDALLLGRWTDGAVLAVRHDASRFPLVERANKRLASVGVAVLGAVLNGCRTMESSYGSYRYTPYAAAEAPGASGDAEV